jgi:hypothetical protein
MRAATGGDYEIGSTEHGFRDGELLSAYIALGG